MKDVLSTTDIGSWMPDTLIMDEQYFNTEVVKYMEWERGFIFEGPKCVTARERERERHNSLNIIIGICKFVLRICTIFLSFK